MAFEKHNHDKNGQKHIGHYQSHVKNVKPVVSEQNWEELSHRLVYVLECLKKNPMDIEEWHRAFNVIRKYEDMCRG